MTHWNKTIGSVTLFLALLLLPPVLWGKTAAQTTQSEIQRASSADSDTQWLDKISPESGAVFIRELMKNNRTDYHLNVLVETTGKGEAISPDAMSGIHMVERYRFGNFRTALVSFDGVRLLSLMPNVVSIYILSHKRVAEGSEPQYSKTRVVIGVIDKGMAWNSRAFWTPDGKDHRILYYWDQTADENEGNKKEDYDTVAYGREYNKDEIARHLAEGTGAEVKTLGHGWKISLIAAGNVAMKDSQNRQLYSGGELTSPIILVNTTGQKGDILDAVAYIAEKAAQHNAKCVINLSYGKHFGPHTGDGIYVRALDAILDDNTLLVVSSGNDGLDKIYYESLLEDVIDIPFQLRIPVTASPGLLRKLRVAIELWAENSADLKVSLISPENEEYGPVPVSNYQFFHPAAQAGGHAGTLLISNAVAPDVGKFKGCRIMMSPGNGTQNGASIPPATGGWHIRVKRDRQGSEPPMPIRYWITESRMCDASFMVDDFYKTVSTLTGGRKILSVGAVDIRDDRQLREAGYANSSVIPDGRFKPDVLTLTDVGVLDPELGVYTSEGGTSAAAALASREIASLWTRFPSVKAQTLKRLMENKIIVPGSFGGYTWEMDPKFRLFTSHQLSEALSFIVRHQRESKNPVNGKMNHMRRDGNGSPAATIEIKECP